MERVEIPTIEEFLICVLCIFHRGYIVLIFFSGLHTSARFNNIHITYQKKYLVF
jgi:hypothetical protein